VHWHPLAATGGHGLPLAAARRCCLLLLARRFLKPSLGPSEHLPFLLVRSHSFTLTLPLPTRHPLQTVGAQSPGSDGVLTVSALSVHKTLSRSSVSPNPAVSLRLGRLDSIPPVCLTAPATSPLHPLPPRLPHHRLSARRRDPNGPLLLLLPRAPPHPHSDHLSGQPRVPPAAAASIRLHWTTVATKRQSLQPYLVATSCITVSGATLNLPCSPI
ncbi:hypothetical protein BS50DRAFT_548133, partial [Corynespora cassiicola Philippines]